LPGASEDAVWRTLLLELNWLHRQMNPRLRQTFTPIFLLFELKTVVLCLRTRTFDKTASVHELLETSLLADAVKEALGQASDLQSTIAALEETFSIGADDLRGLRKAYDEAGLRGFEDALVRIFLEHVANRKLHPVIREFTESFIDLRNIVVLYKHLRWELKGEAPFIRNGAIDTSRFDEILERNDRSGYDDLVRGVTGVGALSNAASDAALESALLRAMTTKLRSVGRESEDVGLILDYVWRVYIQARNLAVLYHGEGIGPDALETELIL
jgi:vacuolar-type H+-ATPase subunit C/Vma6